MHKNFDRLSQVKPENRSRADLIKEEIFDYLEAHIKPCEKVKKYVDKFIAHGAAPETQTMLYIGIDIQTRRDCSYAVLDNQATLVESG